MLPLFSYRTSVTQWPGLTLYRRSVEREGQNKIDKLINYKVLNPRQVIRRTASVNDFIAPYQPSLSHSLPPPSNSSGFNA